jgi:hypothetical protein
MKTYKQFAEEVVGRVQIHYGSKNGYGKPIKVIATVPPMQEPAIDNKYDLNRYIEKYLKDMKSKGIIQGTDYEIVFPHDAKWRKSGKNG